MLVIKNLQNNEVVIASSDEKVILAYLDNNIKNSIDFLNSLGDWMIEETKKTKSYKINYEISEKLTKIAESVYNTNKRLNVLREIKAFLESNKNTLQQDNLKSQDLHIYFVDQENLGII